MSIGLCIGALCYANENIKQKHEIENYTREINSLNRRLDYYETQETDSANESTDPNTEIH